MTIEQYQLADRYSQCISTAICSGNPELATTYLNKLQNIQRQVSAMSATNSYSEINIETPKLVIGNTTFTEPELIALKELLKSTNPELYI